MAVLRLEQLKTNLVAALMRDQAATLLNEILGRMIRAVKNCVQLFVGNDRAVLPRVLGESYRVILRLPNPDQIWTRADAEAGQTRHVVPRNRGEIARFSGALLHFVPPRFINRRSTHRNGAHRQRRCRGVASRRRNRQSKRKHNLASAHRSGRGRHGFGHDPEIAFARAAGKAVFGVGTWELGEDGVVAVGSGGEAAERAVASIRP